MSNAVALLEEQARREYAFAYYRGDEPLRFDQIKPVDEWIWTRLTNGEREFYRRRALARITETANG